ncbi:MAG: MarR family transcriptional regulator [Actinomycetota bacterium]|nr:MarR family transcriptional regulator [Actinomycetota bacterium]
MDLLYEFVLSVKAMERVFDRLTNDAMRPLGISAVQADAIYVLGLAGPLSLKELGELLIAEAGHPSRLVDRLVDLSLVARAHTAQDRRRVDLSLTPKGQALHEQIVVVRESIFRLGRDLIGDLDLEPALIILRRFVKGTEFGELIQRRQTLTEPR